jgi:molybdate transport system substrate-binding protein
MVAGVFPANSHDPVSYPFAVVKSGDTPEARALMTFLAGPDARAIFDKRGFKVE